MSFFSRFTIDSDPFKSEVLRQFVGERNVDLFQSWRTNNRGLAKAQIFKNFASGASFRFLDWIVSNIGSYLINSLLTLYTFNWNQTDQEIEATLNSLDNAVWNQAGQLAANSLIYPLGIGLTNAASKRYPVVTGKALLMAAEEGGEEVRNSIRSFFIASRNALASYTLLSTYLTGRRLIQGAQTQRKEPWILSDQLDKIVDSNKSQEMKSFWNGFKDQTEDAVLDLLFIVNMGIVSQWELHKAAKRQLLGKERLVKYTPDKDNPNSAVWLYGNEQSLMPAITNLDAQSAIIENKDIGVVVKSDPDKALRATGSKIHVNFVYYNAPNGATTYVTNDGVTKRSTKAEIHVSDCKVGLISGTWNTLKNAAKPYERGDVLVTGKLSNGHVITVWASSESEGKDVINNFLPLQNGELVEIVASSRDRTNTQLKKDLTRMYIGYCTFRFDRPVSDPSKATYRDKVTGQGYKVHSIKIPLRRENEPENLQSQISQAFTEG